MNQLFIRVKESTLDAAAETQTVPLADTVDWLLLSENSDVIDSGTETISADLHKRLADKGLSYRDVFVFPPENRVKLHRLALAKGQYRHIEKIAPYLLEEQLAQAPEDLHFTLLDKKNKQAVWVGVVAKTQLSGWLDDLNEMGWLYPQILPIAALLPFWPKQQDELPLLFACEQDYLFKDEDSIIFLPQQLLSQLPKRESVQICAEKTQVENFPMANTQCLPLSIWSNSEPNEKGKLESWLWTIASTVQAQPNMLSANLCHGRFRRKQKSDNKLKAWLFVVLLAAFVFISDLALTSLHTRQLEQQAKEVQQKTAQAFLKLVPDEGRVFYLDRQIQGRIQQAKQGNLEKASRHTPYEVLALIDKARAKVEGQHRIIKLDYLNDFVRLDWLSPERDVLDKIQKALQDEGLNSLMEQVTKRGDQYLASIKITLEN